MDKYNIPTIDLHQPIIDKCGPVPQASCFNQTGCTCLWSFSLTFAENTTAVLLGIGGFLITVSRQC